MHGSVKFYQIDSNTTYQSSYRSFPIKFRSSLTFSFDTLPPRSQTSTSTETPSPSSSKSNHSPSSSSHSSSNSISNTSSLLYPSLTFSINFMTSTAPPTSTCTNVRSGLPPFMCFILYASECRIALVFLTSHAYALLFATASVIFPCSSFPLLPAAMIDTVMRAWRRSGETSACTMLIRRRSSPSMGSSSFFMDVPRCRIVASSVRTT
mmetsp:Transcript_5096/g.12801  ORF Transcript_5096/g.12801 Transcript_5096/m.12801 type:complete len:208 (-) Transcript_5096:490-1113(-)